MIYVDLPKQKINIEELYHKFYSKLADSTGTILIHHGVAKYPGKYVREYNSIKLYLKDENALDKLNEYAKVMFEKYNLNKLFIIHQLGTISKNETILFLAVEAKNRTTAFDSLFKILEEIKSEKLIGLIEQE